MTTAAAATRRISDEARRFLGTYLNDHLAGATSGLDLARRLAREHPGLEPLAAEVAEDRTALLEIMQALGIGVSQVKACAAWALEKLARLKPNGRLFERSPLSSLVELEAMRLGVEGKAAGWRTLRAVATYDDRLDKRRLGVLLTRARRQAELLEEVHAQVAETIATAA